MIISSVSTLNDMMAYRLEFPPPRPALELCLRFSRYTIPTHVVPGCALQIQWLISKARPLKKRLKVVRRKRICATYDDGQNFLHPLRWRIRLDHEDAYIMSHVDATIAVNNCDRCTASDVSTRDANDKGLCLNRDCLQKYEFLCQQAHKIQTNKSQIHDCRIYDYSHSTNLAELHKDIA